MIRTGHVCALVLAAGLSRRMGRQKLVLPLIDGEPMVRRVARTTLASQAVAQVAVVVGQDAREVEAAVRDLPLDIVHNPLAATGMSTSMQAGVQYARQAGYDAIVVLLGDQPGVSSSVIDGVVAEFLQTGGPLVQARYLGEWGHPVLFGVGLFEELLAVEGDHGGRTVVARYASSRVPFDVHTPAPPDVDTPEDYAALVDGPR